MIWKFNRDDVEPGQQKWVFTTHTPMSAGHGKFSLGMVTAALGRSEVCERREVFCCGGGLNMTCLAVNLSHYVT